MCGYTGLKPAPSFTNLIVSGFGPLLTTLIAAEFQIKLNSNGASAYSGFGTQIGADSKPHFLT